MKTQVNTLLQRRSRRACRVLRRVTTVEQRVIIMNALQYSAAGYEKKNDTFNAMLVNRTIAYLEPAIRADEKEVKGMYTHADVMKMLSDVADYVRKDTLNTVEHVMKEMVEERKKTNEEQEQPTSTTTDGDGGACATCENKEDCDASVEQEAGI